jgi:hypothetical protein
MQYDYCIAMLAVNADLTRLFHWQDIKTPNGNYEPSIEISQ